MPKQSSNWDDPSLLIWPEGQVKSVFYVYGKTLVFLEFQNRYWGIAYRAQLKVAPVWLCNPSISNSRLAGFWAALGGIEHETGRRPVIATPLSKYAACRLKTSETNGAFGDTQFFSTLQTNGVDQPKLWLALEIFNVNSGGFVLNDAPVIDLATRQLTNRSAPQSYEFMQEKRIPGR